MDHGQFEWDAEKATANLKKHGVRFADAAVALHDEMALTFRDPDSNGEERFVSIGEDPHGRVLVTVFTHRGDKIRVISCRLSSPGERRRYHQR
jgi:uncharacterized protein